MELSQEMLRLESLSIMRRKVRQQTGIRDLRRKTNRLWIKGLDFHWLATGEHEAFWLFKDVRVHVQIVIPEHNIIGRERSTIRPFMAFTKFEG